MLKQIDLECVAVNEDSFKAKIERENFKRVELRSTFKREITTPSTYDPSIDNKI
jgi:hypothetical protein